ncbi:hypothetical protein BKA61DRAFT_635184 [Leptodontidium sp. MPI-SDFR-AT-0119]|nr:hypothetical protein BKA61DRAFT_635184 [Leptodontidium sp. MPI-SDFR-AT-0119]
MITSIAVCTVYNFTARYVLLVLMAAGLWASNALALLFLSSSFASMPPEVRAVAIALVNAMDKPKYLLGFGVITGMLGFGVFVYIVMHILIRRRTALGSCNWQP